MDDFVQVVLPKSYDLVVGDTFQLFYRGVIEAANPFCYDIVSVCKAGKNYSRYFEFTPDAEGEYPLEITVYSNDKRVLARGETMLLVHEAKRAPKKPVNILCIGDSLTAQGLWVSEAARRLSQTGGEPCGLGLDGFNFIGTCKNGDTGFEGYGGWSWDHYLCEDGNSIGAAWIICDHDKDVCDQHSIWKDDFDNEWQLETIESGKLKFNRVVGHKGALPKNATALKHLRNAQNVSEIYVKNAENEIKNPFCSSITNKIDFCEYCQRNGFDGIDAVYLFLTWNGLILSKEHYIKMANKGKKFVDILHKQFPDAKVKVMGLQIPSVNGGTGANYGAQPPYCDDYGLTRFVLELNRIYEAWTLEDKYKDFMEFINISGQFDSDYNMPYAEKNVNTRSQLKEIVGTNGVHPMYEGYMQIADAVYRNMVKNFCSE